MTVAGSKRRGFTLAEVLVAIAIMVILFALLFAPMMAGLDWVTTGRANIGLQDACRYAMEQLRRELGEAVYVYPAPGVDFTGASSGPEDDTRVINYSQILFNPPARDSFGKVYYPPRPAIDGASGFQKVIRYKIHLVDPNVEYDEFNPFVLFRQELLWNPDPNVYPLGSFDAANNWLPDQHLVENALTPKRGATFVPTTTVGLGGTDPVFVEGYATDIAGNTNLMHLFRGLHFEPQRIVGERLSTQNGVVYKARYGGWDGTKLSYYGASGVLPDIAVARSELDPRLTLYRPRDNAKDAPGTPDWVVRVDSMVAGVRPVMVRWSSDGGAVTCGQQARQAATQYYQSVVFNPALPQRGAWYNAVAATGITPIWPTSGTATPLDEANAPTAYRIDPSADGGGPAIIDPGSVKVRVVATVNGVQRELELKPTSNFDQGSIAGDEFCVLLQRRDYDADNLADGTTAMVRLSRLDPPRPNSQKLFGTNPYALAITSFEIQFQYYYRRNFTYDAAQDAAGRDPFISDMIKADYSVRSIQNVSLTLENYVELEDNGSGGMSVSPDEHPNEVTMREQIIARNFAR